MTFPILGGNSAVAGGYSIDNSIRFNSADSPDLSISFASDGNRKTWTWSGWVKRSQINKTSAEQTVFGYYDTDDNQFLIRWEDDTTVDRLEIIEVDGITTTIYRETNRLFRDVAGWYHIVIALDTTQSTADDRIKIYINGVEETSFAVSNNPSQNADLNLNRSLTNTNKHYYNQKGGVDYGDQYIAETHFIDGQQLSPTDFGEFDEDSGIWKPIQYTGSYGTNGFYLDFENSGSLGADQSGNGNNFTPTNLASTDQTTDTPTNNFATGNPLARSRFSNQGTISEGNLKYNALANDRGWLFSSQGISQGKWYWEVKITATGRFMVGVGYESVLAFGGTFFGNNPSKAFSILDFNGNLYYDGTNTSYGSSLSVNDIVMVALDMDNHLCWFGKNGTWFDSATQSEIENSTATNDATTQMGTQQNLNSGEPVFPFMTCQENAQTGGGIFNFGNPPTGFTISSGNSDGNGYGNFEYAPPSGYLALCTQNLATALSPTIDDGSQYFNTITYTANRTARSLTGVGFQPDWVWIKDRGGAQNHALFDSNRGVNKQLRSDTTGAEITGFSNLLTSFDSDGFSLGNDLNVGDVNYDLFSHVAWNWKAGGTAVSNTDGSITSTVSANTTAGFSIVTYTGTGSAGSVGHGLGVAPKWVLPKARNAIDGWASWHTGLSGSGYIISLQSTAAEFNNGTASFSDFPSSSVINFGGDYSISGRTYVVYCFAEIEGYSKFGSYTGNGSADGAFVYTGFRPAFLIIKRTDLAKNWYMFDTVRNTYNVIDDLLAPNLSDAETSGTGTYLDTLSNGFKLRQDFSHTNASGSTQIYMAFAENPFVTSGATPVTAR